MTYQKREPAACNRPRACAYFPRQIHLIWIATNLLPVGCTSPLIAPNDVLVITSRAPDAPDHFDIHRCAWKRDRLVVADTTRIGPARDPPRPLTLTRHGEIVVEVSDPTTSRASLWRLGASRQQRILTDEDGQLPSAQPGGFDFVLEATGQKLALARYLRHPPLPPMCVERGIIREINPAWVTLAVCDVDSGLVEHPVQQALVPVLRLAPFEWLVVANPASPELQQLNWQTGPSSTIAPWDPTRRLAGAVLSPDGHWAAIASQRLGHRWNLFDIAVWNRSRGTLEPLIHGIFVATRPESPLGPALPMRSIDDRHLAFVTTEADEWRDTLPINGTYYTVIADVPARSLICRLPHPQPGLRNEVPPPYLPEQRLATLRIQPLPPPSPSDSTHGGQTPSDRWRHFFTFRAGQLVCLTGRTFAPAELDLYAYSRNDHALAVRRRATSGPGPPEAQDECIVIVGQRELPPLKLHSIERLTWLPPPDLAP